MSFSQIMIVSFSIANFRSFLQEETFSLVASKRLAGTHEEHTFPIPDSDERVLRIGVVYGANGAGKSNIFKALRYLQSMALDPREKSGGTGRERFRFAGGPHDPSSFDLQFILKGKLYRFGFKVNDERITEEWLAKVCGSREESLYERTTDETGRVTVDIQGLKTAGEKLKALATVGGPQSQSFLATVRATLDKSDRGEELDGVLTWFERGLALVAPTASFKSLGTVLARFPDFAAFAGTFLKSASTGVDHLEVMKTEITPNDINSLLDEDTVSELLQTASNDEGGTAVVRTGEGEELLLERTDKDRFYRVTIQAAHEHTPGQIIPLDISEESDGTRRLLNLIPALQHLQIGSVSYFIDEIDRSLHPVLVLKFVEFFLRSCIHSECQVILTTHESNLLDLELLRRDEIWFAEKDSSAATRLYSLSDFKVRKDLAIRKHYLQGRFGAVPFLADLDRLMIEQGKAE